MDFTFAFAPSGILRPTNGIMQVIVLISGWSGAGKTTLGSCLTAGAGFVSAAFASALKQIVAAELGKPLARLHTAEGKEEEVDDPVTGQRCTVRDVLIRRGAELRASKGPDVFVQSVLRSVAREPLVVITDWRLLDELEAVRAHCAATGAVVFTVRIQRRGQVDSPVKDALTEHQLDSFAFDHVVDNPGDDMQALRDAAAALAACFREAAGRGRG
jgi:hypothetical protein